MVNLVTTSEELNELTQNVTTWKELKNVYTEFGVITSKEIEMSEKFSKLDNIFFQKRERGEISELEYNRITIELDHEHTRACSELYDAEHGVNPDEKCEIDEWLEELDKIIAARDADKISTEEYWRRCFELDKKFNFAYDEDAKFYLGEEKVTETADENNLAG